MSEKINLLRFDSDKRRLKRSSKVEASSTGEITIEDQELMVIQTYLQLTGSVKMELIPANDMNLEMKKFTWYLKAYSETGLSLQLEFENPSYISFGGTDTMKISF